MQTNNFFLMLFYVYRFSKSNFGLLININFHLILHFYFIHFKFRFLLFIVPEHWHKINICWLNNFRSYNSVQWLIDEWDFFHADSQYSIFFFHWFEFFIVRLCGFQQKIETENPNIYSDAINLFTHGNLVECILI